MGAKAGTFPTNLEQSTGIKKYKILSRMEVDSHYTLYMKVSSSRPQRCSECGCAYIVDFQGNPHEHGNEEPKLLVLHEHPGEKPQLKWGWGDMTTHDGGNQR
ncbi:hypothetical protein PTTG_06349 [Puccinia triticina 1-1 BBBD Race 1]|uniref:C2H2-type domain-containing protein n=2 Tax=Puccinia triticina TaxID=208348 RepID=A0A180G784_PUCT1|nr:uncharacterized protein PtA15_14A11 [Puccinia triticina]OAV88555.1 hypothetical protein PTTG_06349 [Puccinia triticina 1-1 BBBD Race 1]WAQ91131.1 hypothetical protein PtA15_14A11 [Puccinia triticina]